MLIRKMIFFGLFTFLMSSYVQAQFTCQEGNCEHGTGKGTYNVGGQVLGSYEGTFKNGKFDKGKFIYAKGGHYEGEWHDFFVHGHGVRYHADGTVEAGRWEKGKLVEKIETEKVLAMIGAKSAVQKETVKCEAGDCKNGNGRSIDIKGNRYEGEFKNGQYSGYGEMRFANGDVYKGLWAEGKENGNGSLYQRSGHTQTGEWAAGIFQGNPMKVWALVVGVADYQNFPKLTFTKTDAEKVYSFLRLPTGGAIPDNQIKLLLDKDATAFNIQNVMADLFEQADTNDLIIFYFAGHGLEGAFLPVDYKKDGSNMLYHTSINNLMMDSPAKFKLILADACHSGSFDITFNDYKNNNYQLPPAATRSGKSLREQIKDYYKSYENVKSGLAIILSSASDEISLEANKLGQGVFSYYVIEGLKGAADTKEDDEEERQKGFVDVTVKELFNYVSKQVDKFTYGFQTPNVSGSYDEKMPVGLVIQKDKKIDDSDK